jgi:hypothetical protein
MFEHARYTRARRIGSPGFCLPPPIVQQLFLGQLMACAAVLLRGVSSLYLADDFREERVRRAKGFLRRINRRSAGDLRAPRIFLRRMLRRYSDAVATSRAGRHLLRSAPASCTSNRTGYCQKPPDLTGRKVCGVDSPSRRAATKTGSAVAADRQHCLHTSLGARSGPLGPAHPKLPPVAGRQRASGRQWGQAGEIIEGEQVAVLAAITSSRCSRENAPTGAASGVDHLVTGQGGFRPGNPVPTWGRPTRGLWLSLTGALLSENERAIYRTGQLRYARASTVAERQPSVLAGASTLACPNGEAGSVRRLADGAALQEPTDHRKRQSGRAGRHLRWVRERPRPK